MNIKKLSFINVALIATVILASAVVFGIVRYNILQNTEVPAFQYTGELIVYPASNTQVQLKEQVKVQVQAKAKVETLPAPKPATVPLPLIPPRVIFKALPEYPESALAEGLEGAVFLSVFVSKSGNAGKVEVTNSSGIADFDKAAVSAVSGWKFEPARRGGVAVPSWYKIPVRFVICNS